MADKPLKGKITAQGTEITVLSHGTDDDYISLTDIARYKNTITQARSFRIGCATAVLWNFLAFGSGFTTWISITSNSR
jgi:hypothetical protein